MAAGVMKNRRYNRRKRILIAYTLRTIVFLAFTGIVFLVFCGCRYLFDLLGQRKEMQMLSTYEQGNTLQQEKITNLYAGKYSIVLDAGHGGEDGGTSSGDVVEKDITLAVVMRMKELLEEEGVEVVLTRDSDEAISLEDRTIVANGSEADLFVSIHCNYYEGDSTVSGLECYYYEDSQEGEAYAEGIIGRLKQRNRITVRNAKADTFYVLKKTNIPAVLIELGYLSNGRECERLTSEEYQEKLASELVDCILTGIVEKVELLQKVTENETIFLEKWGTCGKM